MAWTFAGGVASDGGAIYAEGSSFVFGQGLVVGKNSGPAIQTIGNVTVRLDNSCFADNGLAELVRRPVARRHSMEQWWMRRVHSFLVCCGPRRLNTDRPHPS